MRYGCTCIAPADWITISEPGRGAAWTSLYLNTESTMPFHAHSRLIAYRSSLQSDCRHKWQLTTWNLCIQYSNAAYENNSRPGTNSDHRLRLLHMAATPRRLQSSDEAQCYAWVKVLANQGKSMLMWGPRNVTSFRLSRILRFFFRYDWGLRISVLDWPQCFCTMYSHRMYWSFSRCCAIGYPSRLGNYAPEV